ncbi:MAG TPA: hypothetical protein VHB25_05865 [Gemmatimonadaceae bacterium]|nr:hypothetical protein [Gemmatimonadaceae bacterium]
MAALPYTNPPYALAPTSFRFGALAALAGRAPLGGRREVALAAYLAARLVDDMRAERGLPPAVRAERAGHARVWLSTVALPSAVRPAFQKLIESTGGSTHGVASAVRAVIDVTANFLDSAARLELDQLASALDTQALVG